MVKEIWKVEGRKSRKSRLKKQNNQFHIFTTVTLNQFYSPVAVAKGLG